MSEETGRLLLDTHAFIWFVAGTLASDTVELLLDASGVGGLLVSPITAWEIGLMSRDARSDRPTFDPDPATWYSAAISRPGLAEASFTGAIGLAASFLPGDFHKDPADRLLVATARKLSVPIVTRDRRILDYAAAGHVDAIAC